MVEDYEDTRRAVEIFLQTCGHRTQVAGCLQKALDLAATGTHFDLLLSDIRLPDGNGWDLLKRMEEAGLRPKQAIDMSGWSSETDLAKSKDAGFQTHLIKPLAPEILEAALAKVSEAIHQKQIK